MLARRSNGFDRVATLALSALVAVDILLGVALRFWTTSKLWLDEAQSVNVASKPLAQLTHYLRNDGAPPLYYVLLHVWMGVAGHSDFDVRALSGVISVLGLGTAYCAARSWWGQRAALISVAVLAVLPYAVYFGTETRMYALVMLESALLLWALKRHLTMPRWRSAVALVVVGASLLYTQYWGIYLLVVVIAYVALRWWRTPGRSLVDLSAAGACVVSFVLWIPWVPIFNEQRLHTGTPWSPPPGLSQLFTWVDDFTVNQSIPHVISSLHTEVTLVVFVALGVLGIVAAEIPARSTTLSVNLFGDPRARGVAFIAVATVALGIVASHVDGAAYVPRYAAVIAVPVVFLVARGVLILQTPLRIFLVLALLSAACLWTDKWGVTVQRTQAGEVAAALAHAPANSVVFICPDQLGPSVLRYANPKLTYVGYPRLTTPDIVDWYNYLDAYHAFKPAANALTEVAKIKPDQPVYVVRAPNYSLKLTCWYFAYHLTHDLHRTSVPIVKLNANGFYQPMEMEELVPATN